MENVENKNQEMDMTLEVQSSSGADNHGGWIKLGKKTLEDEIWVKPATWFKLWVFMLMKANYEDGNIKRGQVLLNYGIVQSHIPGMTYGAYRAALSWLKRTAIIYTHRRTRLVLITILNYDTYQPKKLINSPASALPQLSQSTASALPQRFISKEGKKENKEEEKEPQQEVLAALPDLQNLSSIKTSSLNGIVSNNNEDNSRPPPSVISSSPSNVFSDLTNPEEFIRFYFASIKQLRGATINPKPEDLQYAKKTIAAVPRAFRTPANIKSWVTWYLSEYLSAIRSPSTDYYWITSFSSSWEMFYIRKLSNKSMMTLEEGAQPNESTEVLKNPEVLIKTLRNAIQEHQPDVMLPDKIRPIDIITADCIYDLLKTEMCYTPKHLKVWVYHYAITHLRSHPIKSGQHNRYMMHFRGTWDKLKRHLPSPVSLRRRNDTDSDNLMPRIGKMFTKGVSDETILRSMTFFGVQVIANYLRYKLNQDNVVTRISSILNGILKSTDEEKWGKLTSIHNSSMKFSPKEYVSDKILLSNWCTKNLNFWKRALKDDLHNNECLYQSEWKEADAFYEELFGKPDNEQGKT